MRSAGVAPSVPRSRRVAPHPSSRPRAPSPPLRRARRMTTTLLLWRQSAAAVAAAKPLAVRSSRSLGAPPPVVQDVSWVRSGGPVVGMCRHALRRGGRGYIWGLARLAEVLLSFDQGQGGREKCARSPGRRGGAQTSAGIGLARLGFSRILVPPAPRFGSAASCTAGRTASWFVKAEPREATLRATPLRGPNLSGPPS